MTWPSGTATRDGLPVSRSCITCKVPSVTGSRAENTDNRGEPALLSLEAPGRPPSAGRWGQGRGFPSGKQRSGGLARAVRGPGRPATHRWPCHTTQPQLTTRKLVDALFIRVHNLVLTELRPGSPTCHALGLAKLRPALPSRTARRAPESPPRAAATGTWPRPASTLRAPAGSAGPASGAGDTGEHETEPGWSQPCFYFTRASRWPPGARASGWTSPARRPRPGCPPAQPRPTRRSGGLRAPAAGREAAAWPWPSRDSSHLHGRCPARLAQWHSQPIVAGGPSDDDRGSGTPPGPAAAMPASRPPSCPVSRCQGLPAPRPILLLLLKGLQLTLATCPFAKWETGIEKLLTGSRSPREQVEGQDFNPGGLAAGTRS